MDIRPQLSFSNRLSWNEFDAEMWRLYFGFIKGLLMAVTSVLYFLTLMAFFIIQNAAFAACKFAEWTSAWSPEKPKAFEVRSREEDPWPSAARTGD